MRQFVKAIGAAGLAAMLLAGCGSSNRNTYSSADVGKVIETTPGRVVAAREVKISGERSGLGTIGGGVAGIAIGSSVGRKSGSTTGAVVGTAAGLLGALVGTLAEEMLSSRSGIEYTVQTGDGRMITVVQNRESGEVVLPPGSPVMVQWGGGYSRVLPDQSFGAAAAYGSPPAAPAAGGGTAAGGLAAPPAGAPAGEGMRGGAPAVPPSGGRAPGDWINPDTLPAGGTTRTAVPGYGGGSGPIY